MSMEENVLILPNCLHFQVGAREKNEDTIIISSAWSHEGFLPACESVRIPVRLHAGGHIITSNPKFDVFLREATTKDCLYNPGIFWSENTAQVRKHVYCEIEGNFTDRLSPDQGRQHTHLPPTGHILNLMVKNVSKGDPLTREEVEELKSVRSNMSRDNWDAWLAYARGEKKRRIQARNSDDDDKCLSQSLQAVERAMCVQQKQTVRDLEETLERGWLARPATQSQMVEEPSGRDPTPFLTTRSPKPSSSAYAHRIGGGTSETRHSISAESSVPARDSELFSRVASPLSVLAQSRRSGMPSEPQRHGVNSHPSSPTQQHSLVSAYPTGSNKTPSVALRPSSRIPDSAPQQMPHTINRSLGSRGSSPSQEDRRTSRGVIPNSASTSFSMSPGAEDRKGRNHGVPSKPSSDGGVGGGGHFPRTLQEVKQISFHPPPNMKAIEVPRRPKSAPRLREGLGDTSMPLRSAMRPTASHSIESGDEDKEVASRTHFHPYHRTDAPERAVGASPPRFPRSPHDFQNFSWQHKTSNDTRDDLALATSPSRVSDANHPLVGSSWPHNPRSPSDMKRPSWAEKEGYVKNIIHAHTQEESGYVSRGKDKSGISLFETASKAPPPLRTTSNASRPVVSEGTFRLNSDGSLTALQATVCGQDSSISSKGWMIESSPAPPLHITHEHVKQEKLPDRRGSVNEISSKPATQGRLNADDAHRNSVSSSAQLPPHRGGSYVQSCVSAEETSSYAPVQSEAFHSTQSSSWLSGHKDQDQLSSSEDKQLRQQLVRQEQVREEQSKQLQREEEEYVVHRQIEKQREATRVSEPHTAAGAIVKASSLRIDSAYAAAQCLKASLEADMSDEATSERTGAALAMVNAMMNALEKSKTSLTELSAEEDYLTVTKREGKHESLTKPRNQLEHVQSEVNEKTKYSMNTLQNVYAVQDDMPETLGADEGQDHDYMSESSTHFTEDAFDRYTSSAPNRKSRDQTPDEYIRHNTPTSYAHSSRPLAASRGMVTSDLRDARNKTNRHSSDYSVRRPSDVTAAITPSKVHSPSYYRERFDSPPLEASLRAPLSSAMVESNDTEIDLSDGGYGGGDHKPHYFMLSRHNDRSIKKSTTGATVTKQSLHSVRKAKGMPRVMRICVSPGARVKAYEENPLRVDVENCTLDVVWREKHVAGETFRYSRGDAGMGARASTLRRERYSFDDMFTGAYAVENMCTYAKKRTKTALLSGRGVAYMSLAGGEYGGSGASYLEPPMAMLLGDCGGQGIMSAVAEEIFNVKKSSGYSALQKTPTRRNHSDSQHPLELANTVLFTAVIVCDGVVVDLLGAPNRSGSASKGQIQQKRCRVSRRSNGSYYIANVTRLQLKTAADYERVAGVLLGRRAALRELGPSMIDMENVSAATADLSMPETPWLLSSEREACALFSMTTVGEGVSMSSHKEVAFHFVSPCGIHWALPGTEMCLLAEAISGLPHEPPPSLLSEGNITQLLVDPHSPEIDYVTIASVGKQSRDGRRPTLQEDEEMIQNALHSFRVVSQLSAMSLGS